MPDLEELFSHSPEVVHPSNSPFSAAEIPGWLRLEHGEIHLFLTSRERGEYGRRHFIATLRPGAYFPECRFLEFAGASGCEWGYLLVPQTGRTRPNSFSSRTGCPNSSGGFGRLSIPGGGLRRERSIRSAPRFRSSPRDTISQSALSRRKSAPPTPKAGSSHFAGSTGGGCGGSGWSRDFPGSTTVR